VAKSGTTARMSVRNGGNFATHVDMEIAKMFEKSVASIVMLARS
jgi:hypothetical protein